MKASRADNLYVIYCPAKFTIRPTTSIFAPTTIFPVRYINSPLAVSRLQHPQKPVAQRSTPIAQRGTPEAKNLVETDYHRHHRPEHQEGSMDRPRCGSR